MCNMCVYIYTNISLNHYFISMKTYRHIIYKYTYTDRDSPLRVVPTIFNNSTYGTYCMIIKLQSPEFWGLRDRIMLMKWKMQVCEIARIQLELSHQQVFCPSHDRQEHACVPLISPLLPNNRIQLISHV